jgi:flagellar FliL protein
MVSLSAGYTAEGLDTELTEKLPQVSDIVNGVLRAKKLDEVDTPDETDKVKEEMITKINAELTKGKLTKIYFNKILIQ